jgi:hypothetical protein
MMKIFRNDLNQSASVSEPYRSSLVPPVEGRDSTSRQGSRFVSLNRRCSQTRLASLESDAELKHLTQGRPSRNRANPGLSYETPLGFSERKKGKFRTGGSWAGRIIVSRGLIFVTLAFWILCAAKLAAADANTNAQAAIDRHALVSRHNVVLTEAGPKNILQVGNGEFAFGMDITGLQTFLPANTMSHWGWHSFPMPPGERREDFKLESFDTYGRQVGYATSSKGQEELFRWLRENPHRLNLGKIALVITRTNGAAFALGDMRDARQTLDLWQGLVTSTYRGRRAGAGGDVL